LAIIAIVENNHVLIMNCDRAGGR